MVKSVTKSSLQPGRKAHISLFYNQASRSTAREMRTGQAENLYAHAFLGVGVRVELI